MALDEFLMALVTSGRLEAMAMLLGILAVVGLCGMAVIHAANSFERQSYLREARERAERHELAEAMTRQWQGQKLKRKRTVRLGDDGELVEE